MKPFLFIAVLSALSVPAVEITGFESLGEKSWEDWTIKLSFEGARYHGRHVVETWEITDPRLSQATETDGISITATCQSVSFGISYWSGTMGMHAAFEPHTGVLLWQESILMEDLPPFPHFELDYDPVVGSGSATWSTSPILTQSDVPILAALKVPDTQSTLLMAFLGITALCAVRRRA